MIAVKPIEPRDYFYTSEILPDSKGKLVIPAGCTVFCATENGFLIKTPFTVIKEPAKIGKARFGRAILRTPYHEIKLDKRTYDEWMEASEPVIPDEIPILETVIAG